LDSPVIKLRGTLSGLIVIVAGVLLALAADAAWAERGDRIREQELLADLLSEFRENEELLLSDLGDNERAGEAADVWVDAMFGTTSITTDSLQALLMIMNGGARFDPLTGAIRSLVDGGELQVIRRDELRRALAGWSDRAEEARLTMQSLDVLLAGLFPVFLGLDPGGPMGPGERFAVQYAAQSSGWNSQLYELLEEIRRIIEMIENEARR